MARKLLGVITLYCLLTVQALAEGVPAVPIHWETSAILVSASGDILTEPDEYTEIFSLIENGDMQRFAAAKRTENGDRYCLLDESGRALTEPVYESIGVSNGILICRQNGLYGALNADGSPCVSARYTSLISNGADGFLALMTDPWDDVPDIVYYITPSGGEIQTATSTDGPLEGAFSEGKLALRSASTKRYGYVDAFGAWRIEPVFTWAGPFTGGKAIASGEQGYGILGEDGAWLLEPNCSSILDVQTGFVTVEDLRTVRFLRRDDLMEALRVSGDNLSVSRAEYGFAILTREEAILYASDGTEILRASPTAALTCLSAEYALFADGPWGSPRAQLYALSGEPIGDLQQDIQFLGYANGRAWFSCLHMGAQPTEGDGGLWIYAPETSRFALMDDTGAEITEAGFTMLRLGPDGTFIAADETGAGLIGTDGEWIVKLP